MTVQSPKEIAEIVLKRLEGQGITESSVAKKAGNEDNQKNLTAFLTQLDKIRLDTATEIPRTMLTDTISASGTIDDLAWGDNFLVAIKILKEHGMIATQAEIKK